MIERLVRPVADADVRALAQLLMDAVESGAAVSFLASLTPEGAEAWWRKTISESHAGAIFLVARDAEGIIGTVQLHPAWAPNQPHRADIAKLLVHRRSRRSRLGTRLMQTMEEAARQRICTGNWAGLTQGPFRDLPLIRTDLPCMTT
jgi:predicted N-acetyltransferase YhbS